MATRLTVRSPRHYLASELGDLRDIMTVLVGGRDETGEPRAVVLDVNAQENDDVELVVGLTYREAEILARVVRDVLNGD